MIQNDILRSTFLYHFLSNRDLAAQQLAGVASCRVGYSGETRSMRHPAGRNPYGSSVDAEIENLMMADPDTPEGEKLDVLTTLVEAYEARHFPMDLPDPVEALKFEMERKGLTVKDLEPMIGKSNRVYEILNRKRSLTLNMIWKLHRKLGIPAESLIKPTRLQA